MNIKKLITLALFVCTSALSAISFDVSILEKETKETSFSDFHLNDAGDVVYVKEESELNTPYYFNKERGYEIISDFPPSTHISIEVYNNNGAFSGDFRPVDLPDDEEWPLFVYYPDHGFVNLNQEAKDQGIDFLWLREDKYLHLNDQGLVVGQLTEKDDEDYKDKVFTYSPQDGFKVLKSMFEGSDDSPLLVNNSGQILIYSDSYSEDYDEYSEDLYLYDVKSRTAKNLKDLGLKDALKETFKIKKIKDLELEDDVKFLNMNDNGIILGIVDVEEFDKKENLEDDSFVYFVYSPSMGLKILPLSYDEDYDYSYDHCDDFPAAINNNNQVVLTGYKIRDNELKYTGEFGTYIWDEKSGLKQIINWNDYLEEDDYLDYPFKVVLKENGEVILLASIDILDEEELVYWDSKNGMKELSDFINQGDFQIDVNNGDEYEINSRGEILIEDIFLKNQDESTAVLLSPSNN